MKQLLLVAMIHLLILHQYQKDQKEPLASKRGTLTKSTTPGSYHSSWLKGRQIQPTDSVIYSTYQHFPYRPIGYPLIYIRQSLR